MITSTTFPRSAWRMTFACIAGAALLRALLSALVPLLPDETYYWSWTTRLAAGYFDHPPGIAWLVAFGTLLFGDTTTGVRAGPALAALITHAALVFGAWHLAGRGASGATAALRAAVLVTVVPLATLGLVLATPDAALFAAVSLALLTVDRALSAPLRSWTSFAWWTAAGVFLGAAFIAKYTAVLLPLGLVVACLLHSGLRRRFREPGPWWASVVALALFAPVVLWNAQHSWISFRFQLGHGFGGGARGSVLTRELELVGGQLGLASPILFVLMAVTVGRALQLGWHNRHFEMPSDATSRRFALAVISVVPMVFFAISAIRRPVEANWPALIYPSAFLLLASEPGAFAHRRWWKGGVALAAVLLAVVALQVWRPLLPLAPRKDPIARAHGWTTLAAAVDSAQHDAFLQGANATHVAADRYQDASELWFHLPSQPRVMSLNLGGRPNQFDLWETVDQVVGPADGLVVVLDANPAGDSLGEQLSTWFKAAERGPLVVLRRGTGEVAHRRIWLFRDAILIPARPSVDALLSPASAINP